MSRDFQYRYVDYGTRFKAAKGLRTVAHTEAEPHQLFENEMVVDVGGICFDGKNEVLTVVDHHFQPKPGQFPSAAAAILHKASLLKERFANTADDGTFWLVTHRDPDFDAFCAMYLTRSLLSGELPADGWAQLGIHSGSWSGTPKEIDWFNPDPLVLASFPKHRWAVLLAALASVVDNCRPLRCPLECSLSAILYAAVFIRGRNYSSTGAIEFFEAAKKAIDIGSNPLVDSVFAHDPQYAQELAILIRDKEAYERDILCGRRTVVLLPIRPDCSFADWYRACAGEPLLNKAFHLNEIHRPDPDTKWRFVDAMFIRDPRSLLFKEWARNDYLHSPNGEGFIFTAVAYSRGRRGSRLNQSDYFFSIDPERAEGCHLYYLWAELQAAEIHAIQQPENTAIRSQLEDKPTRLGYEVRSGKLEGQFSDPWFDAPNYQCTLIATPNRGSLIGPPGRDNDLSDDPIVSIARAQLEYAIFESGFAVQDFPIGNNEILPSPQNWTAQSTIPALLPRYVRFASVAIPDDIVLVGGETADRIARLMWPLLEPTTPTTIPLDFSAKHVVSSPNFIGIWTHKGIVVAYKQAANEELEAMSDGIRRLSRISRDISTMFAEYIGQPSPRHFHGRISRLTVELASITQAVALRDNRLVARFFEASELEALVKTLRDLLRVEHLRVISYAQEALEWIEMFLVSVYAAHLFQMVSERNYSAREWYPWSILGVAVVAGGSVWLWLFLRRKRE